LFDNSSENGGFLGVIDVCEGLLLRMFMNLYNFEVIDEDAFIQWKEELNDVHPGKGQALFQV